MNILKARLQWEPPTKVLEADDEDHLPGVTLEVEDSDTSSDEESFYGFNNHGGINTSM